MQPVGLIFDLAEFIIQKNQRIRKSGFKDTRFRKLKSDESALFYCCGSSCFSFKDEFLSDDLNVRSLKDFFLVI